MHPRISNITANIKLLDQQIVNRLNSFPSPNPQAIDRSGNGYQSIQIVTLPLVSSMRSVGAANSSGHVDNHLNLPTANNNFQTIHNNEINEYLPQAAHIINPVLARLNYRSFVENAFEDYIQYYKQSMYNLLDQVNRDFEEAASKPEDDDITKSLEFNIHCNSLNETYLKETQDRPTLPDPEFEIAMTDQKGRNSVDYSESSSKDVAKVSKYRAIRKSGFHVVKSAAKQPFQNYQRNYARAISSFAFGDKSTSFLQSTLTKEGEVEEFRNYLQTRTDNIAFFSSKANSHSCGASAKFQKVFDQLSEIFISKYSINWIYNCESLSLTKRKDYVAYRRTVLRSMHKFKNTA
jgi:translation initiation factor 2 beta subunit (eIF-2beta)/eIF-5